MGKQSCWRVAQSPKEEDGYCRSGSVMLSSPHVDSCLKTSRGREAVQESAVKPPVAADNKRAVTIKTATVQTFCVLFVIIFTNISSLTELCRLRGLELYLLLAIYTLNMYVTSALTLMNATPCIIACHTCMYFPSGSLFYTWAPMCKSTHSIGN